MLKCSSRSMVACGVAAVFASHALVDPTSAPAAPLAVFLNHTRDELDRNYDQSAWASNMTDVLARYGTKSALTGERLGAPGRFSYRSAEVEGYDLFRAPDANGPVEVFVHGGAWRGGKASSYHFPPFTDAIEGDLSPERHVDSIDTPLLLASGSLESDEFKRQTHDFANALKKANRSNTSMMLENFNHFEMLDDYATPYGRIGQGVLNQISGQQASLGGDKSFEADPARFSCRSLPSISRF